MNHPPEVQAKLNELVKVTQMRKTAKATLKQRLRQMEMEDDEPFKNRQAILAYELFQMNLSKRQIYTVGLDTQAALAGDVAIELGAKLLGASLLEATGAPTRPEFERDGTDAQNVHVTPTRENLAVALKHLELDYDDLPAERLTATFTVDDEGHVEAVTEAWDEEFGRHPVVALVLSNKDYRKKLVDWIS